MRPPSCSGRWWDTASPVLPEPSARLQQMELGSHALLRALARANPIPEEPRSRPGVLGVPRTSLSVSYGAAFRCPGQWSPARFGDGQGCFCPPWSCGTPGRLRCLAGSPRPVPAAEPITGHWGRKTTFPAWNDISSDPQPSEAATAISSSSFCWRMDRYGVKDWGEGQGLRAHPGWGRAGPALPRCHHPGACWSSVLPAAHTGWDSPAAGHQLRLPGSCLQAGKRRWVF